MPPNDGDPDGLCCFLGWTRSRDMASRCGELPGYVEGKVAIFGGWQCWSRVCRTCRESVLLQ